jgi:hypothetical protein
VSLEIQKCTHRPVYVDCVQVTASNMTEVSEWCGGTLMEDDKKKTYIKVNATKAIHVRQTQAYVGDWVIKSDVGLKVYKDNAFKNSYVPAVVLVEMNKA